MAKESLFKTKITYKQRYINERDIKLYRKRETLSILLDSSLISPTNEKKFNAKVIECGKYRQIYLYEIKRKIKDKEVERIDIDQDFLFKRENKKSSPTLKEIEIKNINRSKFALQRLVKTNEDIFKTFITLTFADNITDIESANKLFDVWRTYIKRLKSDFAYVCVPEFQKRGAVHYHLLTNINYNDYSLLSQEERNIWHKESKTWQIGRDVKGWKYGHNMAKDMKDINVIGYITKYMTKDIDNRLWGKKRYLYSYNLQRPIERLINFDLIEDLSYYVNTFNSCIQTYSSQYIDYFNDAVVFEEYKIGDTLI